MKFEKNKLVFKMGGYPYDGMCDNEIKYHLFPVELIQFKHEFATKLLG